MEYIKIDKIIIKENIRKDYGDMTELTASIKEHGVRKPVELNRLGELVDGYRRIKATKAAGFIEVPYFTSVNTDIDTTTEQILSGIFSKNLNPVEEGHAFVKYMATEKISVKELSIKISKTEGYIQKRIEIVTLPKEITDELIARRIEIGHALLLKKMPEPEAKKYLKEILSGRYSVQEARDRAQYRGGNLKDAKFDRENCKGCKFNGSEQSELFETGKILNGRCMNPGCYTRKLVEHVKEMKKAYKNILFEGENEYSTPKGYAQSYDYRLDKKYVEKCKRENDYLIKIKNDGEIEEFYRIPPRKDEKETESGKSEKQEPRNSNSLQEFKIKFLIDKSIELMQPGTKEAKVLTLTQLFSKSNWNEIGAVKKRLNELIPGIYTEGTMFHIKNMFDAKEKEIDKAIAILSESAFRRVDMKGLMVLSDNFGVDMKKHFVITEEFLKIHTKAQLLQMIKELGIKTDREYDDVKKDDIIGFILDHDTKGKIPKTLN